MTQPGVSLALQHATARLCALAPESIRSPLALAVDTAAGIAAGEFFRALGIWHQPLEAEVVRTWLPDLRLPAGSRVYRTRDAILDLTIAVHELTTRARVLGVGFARGRVVSLEARRGRIAALRMHGGGRINVGADDIVVVATGAGTRGLLAASGLEVPGLRVFRSTMMAARTGTPALVAFLGGGINAVPHELPDGSLLNVFGDSRRHEVAPEEDGVAFVAQAADVDALSADVEALMGVRVPPAERCAWVGLKAEVVPAGQIRSQADHVLTLDGLRNLWVAIPGKLSQAAGTARTLVQRIARARCTPEIARSVWEGVPAGVAALPQLDAKASRRQVAAVHPRPRLRGAARRRAARVSTDASTH